MASLADIESGCVMKARWPSINHQLFLWQYDCDAEKINCLHKIHYYKCVTVLAPYL